MTEPVTNNTPQPEDNNTPVNPPVVETPVAANDDTPDAPAPRKKIFTKGFLKAAFNVAAEVAAGAAVTMAAKALAVTVLGFTGAPVLATLAISAAAVGLAATLFKHARENAKIKRENKNNAETEGYTAKETNKFWTKRNLKRFGVSSGFALIGGALALGFSEGVFQQWFAPSEPVAAAITPPVAPVVTVVPPCPSATEAFNEAVKNIEVSDRVNLALDRLSSTSPSTVAQATKDLAFYSLNGMDGVPQNTSLALELYEKAASAGNLQAQTDIAYLQYHGLAGIAENKAAALASVSGIDGERALTLGEQWAGKAWNGLDTAQAGKFDAASIVQKAITPRCPTL